MSEHSDTIAQVDHSADLAICRAQSDYLNLADHLRVLEPQVKDGESADDKKALDELRKKVESLDIGGAGKAAIDRMAKGDKTPAHHAAVKK